MTKKPPNPDILTNLPDPRAMEGLLHDSLGEDGCTPLEEAQDIMYAAFDCSDPADRIELAREALEICEDCADAWVVLAEEGARSVEEIGEFYAKGVTAGERALGKQTFEESKGHFWGLLETRPYMRASFGLACWKCANGKRKAAVRRYRRLLELNPNDNQGARYHLLAALLELQQHDAVHELLGEYETDGTACWAYGCALLCYREEQDSAEARSLRQHALGCNPYVPLYLARHRRLPKRLPEYIRIGDKTEAIAYTVDYRKCWVDTPGAIGWMLRGKR